MHALGDSAVLGSREYGLSVAAQHHARDGGLLIPTPNQATQKHKKINNNAGYCSLHYDLGDRGVSVSEACVPTLCARLR